MADKILMAVKRRTRFFSEAPNFSYDLDASLGYAQNEHEFTALLRYLEARELIAVNWTIDTVSFSLTAAGHEAISGRILASPVIVFVSSTCFDLLDLRAELAVFLEAQGFIVKLSDDWSRFEVSGTGNSIETCLDNLRTSDVVVCVLDRRYGGVIKSGKYEGKSATQVEVELARELGKPLFFFIRNRTDVEYRQLRANPDFTPEWIEREAGKKKLFFDFIDSCMSLPADPDAPNWGDQFETSVELKKLAQKRLADYLTKHR